MKKQIVQKLKSQSGASILLALLFFMICMMVASAILMAAASNAGKKHSNEEEHQKYLAVSSALQLVMDELKNASYCGQYDYSETQDENGFIKEKIYMQQEGSYTVKEGEEASGADEKDSRFKQLLLPELDYIFRETMKSTVDTWNAEASQSGKKEIYKCEPYSNISKPTESGHTLKVEVAPDSEAVSLLNLQDMTVTVTLHLVAAGKDCYSIELEASQDDYLMKAELTAAVTAPQLGESASPGLNKSDPMTWRIGWVTKERKTINEETP